MKAIFISYNQALNERVMSVLDKHFLRGFSKWELTHGRGSVDGEPHYGSHAWPAMNSSILTITEDDKVEPVLRSLREIDESTRQHGLRAFVWNIEDQL
ncbi:MAG: hypothetical protein LUD76_04765 [Alistipes sp.]|nr:hypothetical protein [Alistipes sp.]MCD8172762.1 hypothetical protein [Alistipes sp.]